MQLRRLVLWKVYFDKGYSILSYVKYPLILVGGADVLSSSGQNIQRVIIVAIIYAMICFAVGFLWLKKLQIIENDIANSFNPFVKKMEKFADESKPQLVQNTHMINYPFHR